jgi:ABC-2 type transport system permease protein
MSSYSSERAMTLAGTPAARRAKVASEPVTLTRAVNSEWIKFRTLRSSWAILGAGILAMLVFAAIVGLQVRHLKPDLQPADISPSGTLQGYYLVQLLVGALGVVFVSGEYGTGMIRSTMTAVPKRVPVLWAKLSVFVAIVAISMTAVSFAAFFIGQAVISTARPAFSLGSPGALRVIIGTGLYLTLLGTIGAGLGWIVRNTAGALVSFVALALVLPVLFGDALGHWGKHVAEFFPTTAGAAFSNSVPEQPSLSPWIGLGVMAAWAAISIVAGYWILRRRDV